MKETNNKFALMVTVFISIILLISNVSAGGPTLFVNEVEIDPPNPSVVSDRCQYVELRGIPGTTVPANTYFISINSDQSNFGFLNAAVNISGQVVGANGTITLLNTVGGTCPNRVYDAGTTILNYSTITTLGKGSEGFYIVSSAAALAAGQDLDSNDDGALNFSINYIDGFNLIFNPEEQYAYGPGANLVETLLGDVPDAVSRLAGNNTPFTASSFFSGELSPSTEETLAYAAPFSSNFPAGAMLTPGAPNGEVVPQGQARADFDGDGKTDLSVFRPTEGNWYLNRSAAGFLVINWGISGDVLVPGDFDGDNKTDTAIFRATNTAGAADFYVLNSNGFVVSGVEWGSPEDVPVIGDYDGDDRDDIAIFRPSNNTWYILNSGGGTTFTTFGASGAIPVPGDYDGDGKTDIATFNEGTWNAMLSGGGTSTTTVGAAGDIPVAGDFDGDSKTDQATFRPSNGTWFIRQSTTTSVVSTAFGATGDIPLPGDYDGDGREDLAIYRSGHWWVLGSTSGVSVRAFGLASDAPVVSKANP